jgi:hypothetical protein
VYKLELVKFKNETINEKEKILIIFSICFLHFYANFSYECNFSFEDYYNQNLINLCTKYNVFIKDMKQFKIFCYSFYYQLIKEIKVINYEGFKKIYTYYNPSSLEEEKMILAEESSQGKIRSGNVLEIFKSYVQNISNRLNYDDFKTNIQKIVNRKIMTPLISTTERVVDMVLSVKFINIF